MAKLTTKTPALDAPNTLISEPLELTDTMRDAYIKVNDFVARADGFISGAPYWFGWALREAYLAGYKAAKEETNE